MNIRRANNNDLDGINHLLMQVLMVHHNGRPDLFKPNTKKYTDEELFDIISDDKKPIFVAVDEHVIRFAKESGCYNVTLNVWSCNESAIKFYEKCGLVPQKVGMEKIL